MNWTPLMLVCVSSGCLADAWSDLQDNFTTTATTGNGPTSSGATPTTSDGTHSSPVATVTGPADEATTTAATTTAATTTQDPEATTDAMANLPPTIELFAVSPKQLSEAGPAALQLVTSDDVVKVRLSLDGVELAKNLSPGDFPREWEALSAKDNGLARSFEVVVEDAEGLMAKATAQLGVQLPPSGAEKCLFEDKGADLSAISALKYTSDAIIAVGSRDAGAGLRLTVWKLDPDHCEVVLPGWPKTIANWTAKPAFAAMMSRGSAVDVDEAGNIIVAGDLFIGGKPQSYVARLNPDGARLWEREGQVGDEVTGVAAATEQFKNRVFVVGSRRTSDIPVRTDGAIWTYFALDGDVLLGSWSPLRAPFTPDELDPDLDNAGSERARAVVIQPGTGNALVVGERQFAPDGVNDYSRAFTVVAHPLGGIVGAPQTSWAPAFVHDAFRSVAVCGEFFLASGWTRDEPPDAKPQPMMFWLAADGALIKHRHLPQLGATEIHGIACDREGKVVSAGTRSSGSPDAQVFTVTGQSDVPVWYETGVAGADAAGAMACDVRGFCGWGGYRTANGQQYAVVRVHHP